MEEVLLLGLKDREVSQNDVSELIICLSPYATYRAIHHFGMTASPLGCAGA